MNEQRKNGIFGVQLQNESTLENVSPFTIFNKSFKYSKNSDNLFKEII